MNLASLPIFRSKEQAAVLLELFVLAAEPHSLIELSRRSSVSPSGVHKEISRLEAAGLVVSKRVGRSRLVSADVQSPFYGDLRALLTKAFGPEALLTEALGTVPGVERAFIYGSWALSAKSRFGRPARDIDVMVLGQPDLDQLYLTVGEVEDRIDRPVNVTLFTPAEWQADDSGFAETVKSGAQIELVR